MKGMNLREKVEIRSSILRGYSHNKIHKPLAIYYEMKEGRNKL